VIRLVIGEPHFARRMRSDTFELMTDREFHQAFVRISYYVDFKGAMTPQRIDERIAEEVRTIRYFGEQGYWKPKTAEAKANELEKIIGTAFAPRAIATARRHPNDFINLDLNFGRSKAIDVQMELTRRLREMLKRRRKGGS